MHFSKAAVLQAGVFLFAENLAPAAEKLLINTVKESSKKARNAENCILKIWNKETLNQQSFQPEQIKN